MGGDPVYGANKIQQVPGPLRDWEKREHSSDHADALALMSAVWAGHVKLDDRRVLTPVGERMRKLVLLT